MIKVKHARGYLGQVKLIISEIDGIQTDYDQAINWLKKKPQDTCLHVHPLRKTLSGKYALSVTDDIRIIFEWIGPNTVRLLTIGKHSHVYPGYPKSKEE